MVCKVNGLSNNEMMRMIEAYTWINLNSLTFTILFDIRQTKYSHEKAKDPKSFKQEKANGN